MDEKPDIISVELVPHRAEWAAMATAESARLMAALGDVVVAVHHIGSTSISGILAKPIVDMLPVVTDLARLDNKRGAVESLGYTWHGEFGIVGRRFCIFTDPASGKRKFQLHFFAQGNVEIEHDLAFRDYLRANPLVAKAYEMEKIRAASVQPHNTMDYNAEKNDWIQRTKADALAWYEKHR